MPRALPLTLVESVPIPVHASGAVFSEQVSALVEEFPAVGRAQATED